MKQPVVINADSHARNSAAELGHSLGSTFSVSSFVKPGAEMKEDTEKLTSEDVTVVWGGSNNMEKYLERDFKTCT
jgi:hypothetical protein